MAAGIRKSTWDRRPMACGERWDRLAAAMLKVSLALRRTTSRPPRSTAQIAQAFGAARLSNRPGIHAGAIQKRAFGRPQRARQPGKSFVGYSLRSTTHVGPPSDAVPSAPFGRLSTGMILQKKYC